jgi:hypothetical protein
MITAGQAAARTLTRARILLKADIGHEGGGWSDPESGPAVEVSRPTVERVRKCFAQDGLEAALFPARASPFRSDASTVSRRSS